MIRRFVNADSLIMFGNKACYERHSGSNTYVLTGLLSQFRSHGNINEHRRKVLLAELTDKNDAKHEIVLVLR